MGTLAVIVFAVLVGLVVFGIMMAIGPPSGWTCSNGKEHDFGPWERRPNVGGYHAQVRKCKVCGWEQSG